MAKDYQTYKSKLNVTFVGVNTCMGNNEKRLRSQIDQFNLKPFAHVLDNTGAIAAAYSVPTRVPLTIVIIDGEGKIALNVGWNRFYGSQDSPVWAYAKALDECLPGAKGMLGELKVPAGAESAAHMYSLQQLDQMEMEFAKVPQSAEVRALREGMKKKAEEYTKKRLPELQAMAESNPLNAYYEAIAFGKAFRTAREAGAVQNLCSKLSSNPAVKKENEAEQMYNQVIAPELAKANQASIYDKKVKPLMDGYLQRYGTTKFGEAMKDVHEALRKTMR